MKLTLVLLLGLLLAGCEPSREEPAIEVKIIRIVTATSGWGHTSAYTIVETTVTHERLFYYGAEVGNPGEVIKMKRSRLYTP